MLTALCKSSTVIAWEITKELAPFYCPACRQEVLIKKGSVNIHHFAHCRDALCEYGAGETEEHRKIKKNFYEKLLEKGFSNVAMEKNLCHSRPDVYFEWKGLHAAMGVVI